MRNWTDDIGRGPWVGDLEGRTAENTTFRTVLSTARQTQLVVMSIGAGEDIGREVHRGHDHVLRIVEGRARVELGPKETEVEQTQEVGPGWAVIVPAGVWHNVVNIGGGDLKLYSLYSPPVYLDATIHRTKAEADAAETFDRALR